MRVICENESCDYCRKHIDNKTYCAALMLHILPTCGSVIDRNVVCGSYKQRNEPQIKPYNEHMEPDGLYPGQIRRDEA